MELLVHLDRATTTRPGSTSTTRAAPRSSPRCSSPRRPNAPVTSASAPASLAALPRPLHRRRRLMQAFDYMTRGRAMFRRGARLARFYDAVKMGLKPEDQRRKLDKSLDVINGAAMQGRMGETKKTDWFNLQEARLQLKSYSQPMMEMAVALPLSDRRLGGRPARHRHALDRRHVGRRAEGARRLGRLRRSARAAGTSQPPHVAHCHLRHQPETATRRQGGRQVPAWRNFRRYFSEVATFPIIPPDVTGDPAESAGVVGRRLHRHPGGLHPPFQAPVEAAPTAVSAASCCWRTTGPRRRRSAATS